MPVNNYRDLDVWQKGMEICETIYCYSKKLPREELYGLIAQMRKASVSIVGNIAEGFGRKTNLDFKRFLGMAKGSLLELETYIELAKRLNYLKEEEFLRIFEETQSLGKMMTRFSQNMY